MGRGEQLASRLARDLKAQGTVARATAEKAFLKSTLVHFGVPVPTIRTHVIGVLRDLPDFTHDEIQAAVTSMWATAIHELRTAAIELLVKRVKLLSSKDVPLIEKLLRDSKTWAYVDVLATHVMGPLVTADPKLARTLDWWAKDTDFWIRRSAMLALLAPLRDGHGDFERFARYADTMLEEREFFIRKAIGWVLRDTGRKRPDIVFEWLVPRAKRASGVTVREAIKYLNAAQQEKIKKISAS